MLHKLCIQTHKRLELIDVTADIRSIVRESGLRDGTAYLYCPHTSCGLTIQENSDPGVQHDMLLILNRLVPWSDSSYRHIEDNSASHLQTSMMGSHQLIFIEDGQPVLGRWQGVYLCEFDGPRDRTLLMKVQPDVWSERTLASAESRSEQVIDKP